MSKAGLSLLEVYQWFKKKHIAVVWGKNALSLCGCVNIHHNAMRLDLSSSLNTLINIPWRVTEAVNPPPRLAR